MINFSLELCHLKMMHKEDSLIDGNIVMNKNIKFLIFKLILARME